MIRSAHGVARLLAVVAHVFHGVWIAARHFGPSSEEAHRHRLITWWSAGLLRRLGVRLGSEGACPDGGHLLVANHVSWLDIIAVHAVCPHARFVSKADVKRWPVLGWLIGAAGTLFIERESKRDALRVVHEMAAALQSGQTVAVFPEGTTSDGAAVLPFHANLLQAAVTTNTPVQPLVLRYAEPGHAVSPRAAYIGDTSLLQSLWWIATARELTVHVRLLPVVSTTGLERRALARTLEERIAAVLSHPDRKR
ncbi:lyso-ornithine lipid acyltransferase [Sphaerotilus hippei]|uniref:Lyso-ornithine lipid acyltransferase n=1 Tax=Sphaerotilus hippei TaxID=744406 RepID=A0A318GXB6_9BURK|nr:lysophospholipid acyltransferase family protein [Sphaerotilus hippei]PXW93845.1 lyso-ornithine lipid acyltransferase [Sphaerotilus hippei]